MASATFEPLIRVVQTARQMPKVNLHLHLEGALRPATFAQLATEQGLAEGRTESEARRILQVTGQEVNLAEALIPIYRACQVTQTAAALTRVAREVVEDQAAQNVFHVEVRVGPLLHTRGGLRTEHVIEALLEGLRLGEQGSGTSTGLTVIAVRDGSPAANLALARAAVSYHDAGVVGFDLAGDETQFPAQAHAQAFAVARAGGLGITVHAGEASGPASVWSAIQVLGAQRIGHGVRSIEDPRLVDHLQMTHIPLEVSVLSNLRTRSFTLEEHPVRALLDRGVRILPSDDDPTALRCSMLEEFQLLHERFGFSWDVLRSCTQQACEAAFMDPAAQHRLAQRLASASSD